MNPIKRRIIKRMMMLLGFPVIGSVIGNAVSEHLITPAMPFLPKVPIILYGFFATALVVLFLLGLVAAVGQLFAKGWQFLTSKELRSDVRESIRRWPASKWDVLPVVATTYFVATMSPLVAMLLVLPEGRLAGVVSQEEFATIFLAVFTPMMLIYFAMLLRWAFEAYGKVKQQLVSGTRRERLTFVAAAAFILVAWVFMIIGELAGWGDLLSNISMQVGG